MVAYQNFEKLSGSSDSEDRGSAAHLAARAYLNMAGPADEHAALYAALIGFLDDPSVKVRAALAYGLLHSKDAPRPIMLALLHDSAIIARAVVQYSPVLIDADLLGLMTSFDTTMLLAASQRTTISTRLAAAIIAHGVDAVTLRMLKRHDVPVGDKVLGTLAETQGDKAAVRGALLGRPDLPATARLLLVHKAGEALRNMRIVKGAVAPERLDRIMRNSCDTALSLIGEREAERHEAEDYASTLILSDRINTRILLHAVVSGHVMFFAGCVAELAQTPRSKVFTILEKGSRPALNALLARCGLGQGVRNLLVRLVLHARAADLADDAAARHYVVTALTEELIAEHDGVIPPDLEEAFAYLGEQNILLARKAARGVMAAFARDAGDRPGLVDPEEQIALPAA